MTDGWRVGMAEDEICLEYILEGKAIVILAVEQTDIGYAFLKGGQFIPGGHDASTDLPGAIEEIKAYIRDLVGNAQEPMVGKYRADYSPLTPEEIAKEDPELTELYENSKPVGNAQEPNR